MDTSNIVIQPGTLTKIEVGATYAITISQVLPREVIADIQEKWENDTGSKIIILNGVK